MKEEELRIGNMIHLKSKNKSYLLSSGHDIDEGVDSDDFDPILLTEEWLGKMGFFFVQLSGDKSYKKYIHVYTGTRFRINVYKDWFWFVFNGQTISIKYVHEVQNMCFALSGMEILK